MKTRSHIGAETAAASHALRRDNELADRETDGREQSIVSPPAAEDVTMATSTVTTFSIMLAAGELSLR